MVRNIRLLIKFGSRQLIRIILKYAIVLSIMYIFYSYYGHIYGFFEEGKN